MIRNYFYWKTKREDFLTLAIWGTENWLSNTKTTTLQLFVSINYSQFYIKLFGNLVKCSSFFVFFKSIINDYSNNDTIFLPFLIFPLFIHLFIIFRCLQLPTWPILVFIYFRLYFAHFFSTKFVVINKIISLSNFSQTHFLNSAIIIIAKMMISISRVEPHYKHHKQQRRWQLLYLLIFFIYLFFFSFLLLFYSSLSFISISISSILVISFSSFSFHGFLFHFLKIRLLFFSSCHLLSLHSRSFHWFVLHFFIFVKCSKKKNEEKRTR